MAAEGLLEGRKRRWSFVAVCVCVAGRKCHLACMLSLLHHPVLCKQVWDGAHPLWDAFMGLCVYIKSSSNQLKSSVTYDHKISF